MTCRSWTANRRTPLSKSRAQEAYSLWQGFWDLIEDARLREELGVRVAQIEAPAVPLDEGQIWEVTLDAAGGLNLTLKEPGTNFIPPWCGDEPSPIARMP